MTRRFYAIANKDSDLIGIDALGPFATKNWECAFLLSDKKRMQRSLKALRTSVCFKNEGLKLVAVSMTVEDAK